LRAPTSSGTSHLILLINVLSKRQPMKTRSPPHILTDEHFIRLRRTRWSFKSASIQFGSPCWKALNKNRPVQWMQQIFCREDKIF
jgi:hypothetical protein